MHSAPCRVKSYEGKLATLTAINSALQSENGELRQQLDAAAAPTTATGGALLCRLPAAAWEAPLRVLTISLRRYQQHTHHTQINVLSLPPPLPARLHACPPAEADVAELQEEFARRLGQADRAIAALQAGTCLCPAASRMCTDTLLLAAQSGGALSGVAVCCGRPLSTLGSPHRPFPAARTNMPCLLACLPGCLPARCPANLCHRTTRSGCGRKWRWPARARAPARRGWRSARNTSGSCSEWAVAATCSCVWLELAISFCLCLGSCSCCGAMQQDQCIALRPLVQL